VLNPLTNNLLIYFDNDWQKVQRIYSLFIVFFLFISYPLFTEKYATEKSEENEAAPNCEIFRYDVFFLKPHQVSFSVKVLWMTALLFHSCANNSIQINLVIH